MQTDTQKYNETVTPNSKEIEILKKYLCEQDIFIDYIVVRLFLLFTILYYGAKIVIIFELTNKKKYFFYIFYF